MPQPAVAAGRIEQRRELLERAPQRAACARRVLQVESAVLRLFERLARSPCRRA